MQAHTHARVTIRSLIGPRMNIAYEAARYSKSEPYLVCVRACASVDTRGNVGCQKQQLQPSTMPVSV